jgi:hypothetical protein
VSPFAERTVDGSAGVVEYLDGFDHAGFFRFDPRRR